MQPANTKFGLRSILEQWIAGADVHPREKIAFAAIYAAGHGARVTRCLLLAELMDELGN